MSGSNGRAFAMDQGHHGTWTCPTSRPFPLIYLTSKSNPEFLIASMFQSLSTQISHVLENGLSVTDLKRDTKQCNVSLAFFLALASRERESWKRVVFTVNSELN